MGSSLVPTISKTQEDINKIRRSTRSKEGLGDNTKHFLGQRWNKNKQGQSEYDQ